MQDFRRYDYTIHVDDLAAKAMEAAKYGCSVLMVINGEYYDVTGLNDEKEGTNNDRQTA